VEAVICLALSGRRRTGQNMYDNKHGESHTGMEEGGTSAIIGRGEEGSLVLFVGIPRQKYFFSMSHRDTYIYINNYLYEYMYVYFTHINA
jgi:hypothetical protein